MTSDSAQEALDRLERVVRVACRPELETIDDRRIRQHLAYFVGRFGFEPDSAAASDLTFIAGAFSHAIIYGTREDEDRCRYQLTLAVAQLVEVA